MLAPAARKPLTAMRENIEAIRQLFTMEEVTYEGEFVTSRPGAPRRCLRQNRALVTSRMYIGATGPKMLELSPARSATALVLNYVVSAPDYIREAVATGRRSVRRGPARRID